jgi:hypothetical protein
MKKKPSKKQKQLTPAEERKQLTVRFGTDVNFVSAVMALTYTEMVRCFGEPCKTDMRGCANCDAWHEWHTSFGKVTVQMDRDSLVKMLLDGDL